jgi:hypothetical protein
MSDHHQVSAEKNPQQKVPVTTSLRTSSTSLALDGQPPFVTTTEYECITAKPIWAMVGLFTHRGKGVEIRDPARVFGGKAKRIGPTSTIIPDEWDELALELEETELVRLEPGQKFSTTYTMRVVPYSLRSADTHAMQKGKPYIISLRTRKWRWVLEDELEEGLDKAEIREILSKKDPMEWKADCEVAITTV